MRKTLLALLTVPALFAGSSAVLAADLGKDMDIIGDNYNVVLKTNKVSEMTAALEKMGEAAVSAKSATPVKLDKHAPDSVEMQDYRHGMDLLIRQVDETLKLAEDGKVEEAKTAAEAMKNTRNIYHKKYR